MKYGYATPTSGSVAYASTDVRAEFIRKVYGLFYGSLLVTVLVGAFCAQPAVAPALLAMWPVLGIVGFVCVLAMSFARRTSGLNLALLALYAAIQGAILGPILTMVSRVAPGVPAEAAFLTISVFGGLTLYAMQSKRDFNFLGGMLFVALIALLIAGIVMFFVNITLLHTLYCVGGVLIFSGFVLYDTSRIMHHLQPGEEVVGALEIYLDFLLIFQFILSLLTSSQSRD